MSVSRHCLPYIAASLIAALSMSGSSLAATGATKDEAVAMVKKAVAFIQTEGPANAYPQITNPSGRFVDRDLYIVVYDLDGMVLAYGANANRAGTNQIADRSRRQGVREGARRTRRDSSELLADLQIHEPGDPQGRAEGDVLRAARPDGGVRRGYQL